ncbi:MAG: KEOPS complex subunit Cgi121 [Promethearchaeota archaeon]
MNIKTFKSFSTFDVEEDNGKSPEELLGTGVISFKINNLNQNYISDPNKLFKKIDEIGKENHTFVQMYNDLLVLSEEHLHFAAYFAERSFLKGLNISNKKKLEYLLYVSQQRQINVAIDTVGFKINHNKEIQKFVYTITGNNKTDIQNSLIKISKLFMSEEKNEDWSLPTRKKMDIIIKGYNISDFEILNSLMCSGYPQNISIDRLQEDELKSAILRCLIERMVLLSIEK